MAGSELEEIIMEEAEIIEGDDGEPTPVLTWLKILEAANPGTKADAVIHSDGTGTINLDGKPFLEFRVEAVVF